MAKRKLSSTRKYLAQEQRRNAAKKAQRKASAKAQAKAYLKRARQLQGETHKLRREIEKEKRRGIRANRRLLARLIKRLDSRMLSIERLLGTYRPKSSRMTRSRRAATRGAWKKTERLLNRLLPSGRSSKSRRRTRRRKAPMVVKRSVPRRRAQAISDHKLQIALHSIREGKSVREAAHEIAVPYEQLLQQLKSKGALQKKGSRWVFSEKLSRRMLIYSDGKALTIVVGTRQDARIASIYNNAVKAFRNTRDPAYLEVFRDGAVTDVNGITYPLEVDPNVVLRLSFTGNGSFESIYRYVLP